MTNGPTPTRPSNTSTSILLEANAPPAAPLPTTHQYPGIARTPGRPAAIMLQHAYAMYSANTSQPPYSFVHVPAYI